MTGSLSALALAVMLFVGSHVALAAPPLRRTLVAWLGEMPFRSVYSLISAALLVWVLLAYRDAPVVEVWSPPTGAMHLSLAIMPIACILLVTGFSTASPTSIYGERAEGALHRPTGILAVTRHPVMWSIVLWGIAHLLANGDAAGMLLFGGMTVLALGGAAALDRKKQTQLGPAWQEFAQRTSFWPFAAMAAGRARLSFSELGWWRVLLGLVLYGLLLWAHPWLFGVNPLPL